jgi:hypothetical protein
MGITVLWLALVIRDTYEGIADDHSKSQELIPIQVRYFPGRRCHHFSNRRRRDAELGRKSCKLNSIAKRPKILPAMGIADRMDSDLCILRHKALPARQEDVRTYRIALFGNVSYQSLLAREMCNPKTLIKGSAIRADIETDNSPLGAKVGSKSHIVAIIYGASQPQHITGATSDTRDFHACAIVCEKDRQCDEYYSSHLFLDATRKWKKGAQQCFYPPRQLGLIWINRAEIRG